MLVRPFKESLEMDVKPHVNTVLCTLKFFSVLTLDVPEVIRSYSKHVSLVGTGKIFKNINAVASEFRISFRNDPFGSFYVGITGTSFLVIENNINVRIFC